MISKILMSGYNDSGNFPPAEIIPQFSKGLDRDILKKRASIFDSDYDKFERKPGVTYIHLISCAAGEHYGPNSRADFYNGDSYVHEYPQPKKGAACTRVLDGGLNKYHNETFMKEGGVYTEHYSSRDGAKPQGYIVAAKVNPVMHRGELIIGVKDKSWEDDLQKLSKGIPLKFSIGADVASDNCSICNHVAHTEDEHCDHYKNHRGEILEDGSQCYVISDKCVFHDISRVKTPAEKIAFSIRKVASHDDLALWTPPPPNVRSARYFLKTSTAQERLATLDKLAKIEKRILAEAKAGTLDSRLVEAFRTRRLKKQANGSGKEELDRFMRFANEDQVLAGLRENKRVLSPEEFIDLMIPSDLRESCHICCDDVRTKLPGLFSDILHSAEVDNFCEDHTYEPECTCNPMLKASIKRSDVGLPPGISDVVDAIVQGLIPMDDLQSQNKTIIVKISTPGSGCNDTVAKHYANYVTSAARDLDPSELTSLMLGLMI